MLETKSDFQSAEEWAKKYRPMKKGSGIRDCAGGTLFDPFGEDRKYVGRMDDVFVWSVRNNGHFDYIQNGFSTDAIGYLVSDNPVRFTEVTAKFAIGYEHIDWKAYARFQESGHDGASEGHPEEPVAETILLEPAPEDAEYTPRVEPNLKASIQGESGVTPDAGTFAPPETVNSYPAGEEASTHTDWLERVGEGIEHPEDVQLSGALMSYPGVAGAERSELVAPDSYNAEAIEAQEVIANGHAGEIPAFETQQIETHPNHENSEELEYKHAVQSAQLSGNEYAGIEELPVEPGDEAVQEYTYEPANACGEQRDEPTETAPYASEYPAAGQYIQEDQDLRPEWTAEPATQELVVIRQLPIGREAAQHDLETYGPWPNAVTCKGCRGNGCFAGIQMSGIGCDKCDERGWNPAPGTPHEIHVYA